jgi:hypothetical protein
MFEVPEGRISTLRLDAQTERGYLLLQVAIPEGALGDVLPARCGCR